MKRRTMMLRRAARRAEFTDRELAVFTLLVEGHTNTEVADELGIEVGTVRGHTYRARRRMGVRTNEAMVAELLTRTDWRRLR